MGWFQSSTLAHQKRYPYWRYLAGAASARRGARSWVFLLLVGCVALGMLIFSTSLSAYTPTGYADTFPSAYTATEHTATFDEAACVAGAGDAYVRPYTGEYFEPREDENEWTWERVSEMVQTTRGFYVRDWPLHLGWNNVRYIIEAGMLHASLLNRTLVIPSYIYARSCALAPDVCARFAKQFHRGGEIGLGDFAYLSDEEQIAWRLPISVMLDLPRLRRAHSVITVAEYLRLQELDPVLETPSGAWSESLYHAGSLHPTLRALDAEEWDSGFLRVDRAPPAPPAPVNDAIHDALAVALGKDDPSAVMSYDEAQKAARRAGGRWADDASFADLLAQHGFAVLYTFRGTWAEMFKAVSDWAVDVAPAGALRGLVNELGREPADVVHVRGETHNRRKAGQLRFTTEAARTQFVKLVLRGVHPIAPVRAVGERLACRMLARNGGRQYMAAHMRRGDFAVIGWAEKTLEEHTARVKARIADGLDKLRRWAHEPAQPVPVPGIALDAFGAGAGAPREGDRFYLATDATGASSAGYLREQGAVLLGDLLESEDQKMLGWIALFGDVRAQVEQEVATRAAYFYGHSMSSVAGGVANLRAARGRDPRTCYVD